MDRRLRRKVIAGGVAAAAIAGAGGAIAADKIGSPKEESQAIVSDAAKQLGVQPSALSAALKKAIENRIDAAVAAGEITKAQGDELKARIESSDFPLFAFPHRGFGLGPHADKLDAAASYLGITEAQLRSELQGGKSLAQVAKDHGKSVDGLVDVLVAEMKQHLDAAVAAGRITKAQEDQFLAEAKQRITDFVNGKGPGGLRYGFRRFGPPPAGFRHDGAPPFWPAA
ncbi:MAG TPA: hypothetical protein VF101_00795 [Gaiellaceae bacterium]